jgi:hypothetical protein
MLPEFEWICSDHSRPKVSIMHSLLSVHGRSLHLARGGLVGADCSASAGRQPQDGSAEPKSGSHCDDPTSA